MLESCRPALKDCMYIICEAPASKSQLRDIQNLICGNTGEIKRLSPWLVTHGSHFGQACQAIHTGRAQGMEQCQSCQNPDVQSLRFV